IWSGAEYPSRVRVRVIEALTPETAVPALDLRDRMPLFRDLKNPNKWSIYFRSSPGRLSQEDAEILEDAILHAKREPVMRPIRVPRGRQRPQVIETPEGVVVIPEDDEAESEEPTTIEVGSSHSEIQWQLLKLGSDMGLNVWVARNDRSREWKGHAFADVPRLI